MTPPAAEHFRVPPSDCPSCGKLLDAARDPLNEDARPQRDDLTVCLYCDAILAFAGDGGGLRLVTPTELARLSPPERRAIAKVRWATRNVRNRRPS